MSEPNILFQQKDVLRRFLESAAERERKEFDLETLKKTQTEEVERTFGQLRHVLEEGRKSVIKAAENAFRTVIQIAEDKKNAEREAVLMSSRNLIEETEKILAEVMASHRRTLTLIEKAKIKGNHALPPPTKKDYVNPLENLKELKANSEVACRLTRELEKNVNDLASRRAFVIDSIMVLLVIGLAMFIVVGKVKQFFGIL